MRKLSTLALVLIFAASLFAANGDQFGSDFRGQFGAKLLDAQTTTSDGVWVDAKSVRSASACFSGLESGGTVEIHVSNDVDQPANATNGFVAQTITSVSNSCLYLNAVLPVRWLKAKKSVAGGSATATTVLFWGQFR